MKNSRDIAPVFPAVTRSGRAERRLLFKAAGGTLAVHVALFAVLAAWSGGGRPVPPPAGVIAVDIHELDLPAKQARAPEKARPPKQALTVATVAPPAQAPVVQPASTPAPASSSSPPTATPARSAPSAEPATDVPRASQVAAPPFFPPGGMSHDASAPTPATSPPGRGGYLTLCRALIENNKYYPVSARRGRIEGTVMVSSVLGRDGSIRRTGVVRTSGSTLLDNAAMRAVRSVGRFPPLPPELHGDEFVLEVPISYRLHAQ